MTTRLQWHVEELRRGPAVPLGPRGYPSGIDKQPVSGPLHLAVTGFEADQQGDTVNHGGPDKAVHIYARDHYAVWRRELPHRAASLVPGGFGENLVVPGIDETAPCLGDRLRLGSAIVEVSQGRQPCWKLSVRFNQTDMPRRVQDSGRTGWYFRVLEEGEVEAGCMLTLLDRPHPAWTIARINRLFYHDTLNIAALRELSALPGLTPSWRRLVENRLSRLAVEDWRRRLDVPQS